MRYRLVLVFLVLSGGAYFGGWHHHYTSSDAFAVAAAYLRETPEVGEALGGNTDLGILARGRIDAAGEEAELDVPIRGVAGRASVSLHLGMAGGRWRVVDAVLHREDGRRKRLPTEDADRLQRGRNHAARGYALFQHGDPKGALAELEAALEQDPGNGDATYWLGHTHESLGNQEAAIAAFQQTLLTRPNAPEVHYFLALAYERLGDLDRNLQHMSRVVELQPGTGEAHFARAAIRRQLEDHDGAHEDLRSACRLGHQGACSSGRAAP